MRNRIRIESGQNVVTDAKILYVQDDGSEIDISRCVTGVDVHLHVGEVSRATLHVLLVEGHVSADLTRLLVSDLRLRSRWWRFRRRVREVTAMGSSSREYVA